MSLVTLNGSTVLQGHVAMHLSGAWTFEGKIDVAKLPSGKATIECAGGLTLIGTVAAPSGVFLDSSHVWVVGGASGLSTQVSGSYQSAQLRDPLGEIMRASGETLSSAIASSILSVALPRWTLGGSTASSALDALALMASGALASSIGWRVLPDGTIWIGAESWTAATLPKSDELLSVFPAEGRSVIGAATPSLTPGVDLDGVGKVLSVDHWIERDSIRTWAWT